MRSSRAPATSATRWSGHSRRGAPAIDGIVEEGWPSVEHVADPRMFFNASSDEELAANVTRMLESVTACLDLGRLRSSTMSEYLVAPLH